MRVADTVVDILKSEGVKFVAALSGDDVLPLFDAFHRNTGVPLILTRQVTQRHTDLEVILNNESLGASRETLHERFKGHEIGISLRGDYAAMARALGAYGERVEQPHELQPALSRALAHPRADITGSRGEAVGTEAVEMKDGVMECWS